MVRFLSLLLQSMCACVVSVVMWCLWSACEVVVVPYVDAVVAVTVMRVLLLVLHVCMLKECDGARVRGCVGVSNAGVGAWRRCGCGDCSACGWYTWFRYCG